MESRYGNLSDQGHYEHRYSMDYVYLELLRDANLVKDSQNKVGDNAQPRIRGGRSSRGLGSLCHIPYGVNLRVRK